MIPSEYVARRHEWRRQLQPDAAPDAAAERIDPSFASAATAISDCGRRVGWLREIEHRTEGEMREHLSTLDEGMDHLIGLSRRAGLLRGRRPADGWTRGLSTETGGSNMARLSGGHRQIAPSRVRGQLVSGPAPL